MTGARGSQAHRYRGEACYINPRRDTHRCKLQLHCRHSWYIIVVDGACYETSEVVASQTRMQATRSRPPVLQATQPRLDDTAILQGMLLAFDDGVYRRYTAH